MTSFLDKARTAWSGTPPSFVVSLASFADREGLTSAGALIGYGKSAVSLVISNRYGGNPARIEAAVCARLGAKQTCPVLGEIDDERCAREQASATRNRTYLTGLLRLSCPSCPRRKP